MWIFFTSWPERREPEDTVYIRLHETPQTVESDEIEPGVISQVSRIRGSNRGSVLPPHPRPTSAAARKKTPMLLFARREPAANQPGAIDQNLNVHARGQQPDNALNRAGDVLNFL